MPTFRNYIDDNKRKILLFLSDKDDYIPTWEITRLYSGEKETTAVRKALNELKSEGKVISETFGLNEKRWKLTLKH